MRFELIAILGLLALPLAAAADTPAKPAAEKRDKKDKTDKSGKVFTNDDLKDAGKKDGGGAVTFLAEPEGGSGGGHGSTGGSESASSSGESGSGESRNASSEEGRPSEDGWRAQAKQYRTAVALARTNIEKVQAKLDAMTNPQQQPKPSDALQPDPHHLLTRSEEREALERELQAARNELEDAERALADFMEDARKQNVPPGWVEEGR